MTLELQPGESRGYWKYHVPGKHFKQAKANSKINNMKTVVLLDSGSEVSIIDATFARKVGRYIDTSQSQECLGIGEKLYVATGRTKIKLTLAGSLVYLYEVWVGDDLPPDYQAILGMDFMVPAGIRLDLGDGSMCLPNEIRVMLHGRRQIFSDKARPICVGEHLTVGIAESAELPLRLRETDNEKLWLTRGQATIEVRIEDLQVGDLADNTEDEIRKLRDIIWAHRHLLIGKGNALPPAAVGAICDIDVGDATPIAQRVRKIAPQFREKVSDLLKGLLSAKIIRHSTSPWASPIVVIIKKNGVDIRLCIDYRLVNGLTKLMIYPMPLINDLLEDLDKVLWYCSLDMASGFWVMSMADRARAISAFITPFGLFEWNRMPFGLKNAPQIYQRLIDNALYGFLRIPPAADQNALTDLFKAGDPEETGESSVLGRRSYIDDILVTAGSWDLLCDRVKALLEACDKWNISISVAKSFWGLKKVDYLGHRVSNEGLEAHPKDLSALTDLPFPRTLRAMQSFLDFAAIRDRDRRGGAGPTVTSTEDPQDDRTTVDPKWVEAEAAFSELKKKIAATPILRHFDTEKRPVVIVYASEWAVSASLVQDHDGIYLPVMFTSRTLKQNELNYGIVEKEVLALLRMLDLGYSMLVGRSIQVLARHSTLAWLFRAAGLQGRLGQWAALLSPWTLEITKCTRGEDEILGSLATAVTPRSVVDQALTAIAPRKEPRRSEDTPVPTVEQDEVLLVASFDGSARVKRGGGAFSAIIWRLPEWTVVKAAS
ncbi:hypothetical protein PR003_g23643 [Phytophthora rubi]|uniref:RNA-directed DNA polymerase n=1 Tax=Phytophthora rubi TaxID=129364 RepID=A0A6A4CUN5_9STRA|nr:hypothetical protein PR003_g23643 [Phytophthora rubi]